LLYKSIRTFATSHPFPSCSQVKPNNTYSNIDDENEQKHLARLNQIKKELNSSAVQRIIAEIERAAQGKTNIMHFLLNAVREYATPGDI